MTLPQRLRLWWFCGRGRHRDRWSSQVTSTGVNWRLNYAESEVWCVAHCRDCLTPTGPVSVLAWAPMETLLAPGLLCPDCQRVHNRDYPCP